MKNYQISRSTPYNQFGHTVSIFSEEKLLLSINIIRVAKIENLLKDIRYDYYYYNSAFGIKI